MAEGKTSLTFKLPQAVEQTFIWPETGKEVETKQKETVKPLKRRRGRPRKPDAGEKAEKITELKATGKYSWKEIGKEVGMTAAAARQLHYRYNKKNIINTCK